MVHVLDDFLIIAPSCQEAWNQLQTFLKFCEECGIPIGLEKPEGPYQTMTCLGVTLDVCQSFSMLPQDKLLKCRILLQEALARKSMTLRDFQSLLGHLNFACKVVVPGRAFIRRLYALTHKARKSYHHLKMTKEVKADLRTWLNFLSEYNGRSFFLLESVHMERALKLYTDSSKSIR